MTVADGDETQARRSKPAMMLKIVERLQADLRIDSGRFLEVTSSTSPRRAGRCCAG